MAKWPLWGSTRKFNVKLRSVKLHRHEGNGSSSKERSSSASGVMMAVEVALKGPANKFGFFSAVPPPFNRKSHHQYQQQKKKIRSSLSREQELVQYEEEGETSIMMMTKMVEWDDEFDYLCNLSPSSSSSKDNNSITTFSPWFVSFHLLLSSGQGEKSEAKLTRIGQGFLNLGELASSTDPAIQSNVPISLQLDDDASQATLSVTVIFTEVKDLNLGTTSDLVDLLPGSIIASDPSNEGSLSKKFRSFIMFPSQGKKEKEEDKKAEKTVEEGDQGIGNSGNSDDLAPSSDLESRRDYVVLTNDNGGQDRESDFVKELQLQRSLSSETQLDIVRKAAACIWKWNRRLLSIKYGEEKNIKPSMNKIDESPNILKKAEVNGQIDLQVERCGHSSSWETKELASRDGKTMLRSDVFFASYDQRSQAAAGEGACTAIVAVVAHWLQSNQDTMPTTADFDRLILEGSLEWRKLREDEAHASCFPDGHFDLETVLQAELRPLSVLQERSFVGFFFSDKFKLLKEAKSFDDIWEEIDENFEKYESGVFIVSWNDHFFVLNLEADAYYIIDSLGERLHEGCNQAYILKFDDSSFIYAKAEGKKGESEKETIICRGKQCCREYIKRFLAAIPVSELQEAEEKGTVSAYILRQRLQIEFHFTSHSSASSSSASFAGSSTSLFSDEENIEASF